MDGSGTDDRTLTRAERSRVAFWLLVIATAILGIFGLTKLVPVPSDPTPPEAVVVQRSSGVVRVAVSACRGRTDTDPLDVMLAPNGRAASEWQLVYSAVPDDTGWLRLPDDIVRQLAAAAESSAADSLVLRTTLRGTTGATFDGIASMKLATLSSQLGAAGDWVLVGDSTVPVAPSDICHA